VLGPFWITIATGTTAVAMGGLYSKLFHLDLSVHLPYVTLGLIIWNLINAAILEGADVFVANEGLIKQLPTPLSVHVYRLVWRQMILFAHNIVIYLVVAIIYPKPWSWADLSVIPALGLIVLNCIWGVTVFRHPGDSLPRHRSVAVLGRAVALLHDADHLERRHFAAAGRRELGEDRRTQPRCCTISTSSALRCSARTRSCGTGPSCWC